MKKGNIPGNPFNTYDQAFQNEMAHPYEAFSAVTPVGAEELKKRQEISDVMPQAVSLPPHLFIPDDSQSVDIRNLANVPAGLTVSLLSFTAPQGGFVKFINYAVFFDALMFSLINLVPTVNNVRVFPFHGNPQFNYKIGLGVGDDLSNTNLIACQLDLQPGDVVNWQFTNNDVVDVAAGVRMVGYYSQSIIRKLGRLGG